MQKASRLSFVLSLLLWNISAAQTIDDFNYTGNLTDNGWSVHSGTTTNPIATTTGLTYTGYISSGIGNAALIQNLGGQDVNKTAGIGPYNTDGAVIYFSFMVNVTETGIKSGDYFIHIGNRVSANSFTYFCARVFAKVSGSVVNFGLSNTSTATYGTTNFSTNTTYLLVVKYIINNAGNDEVDLWVFSSGVPSSEVLAGIPEVSNTSTLGQDIVNAIALRQGLSTTSVQTIVDGIRLDTSWSALLSLSDLTTPAATAASNITANSFTANWSAVNGATDYWLDVSTTSGFSTFVTGYNMKEVGNVTGFDVTGLDPNTTYYYRVRASNNTGTSANSNTITVTTLLAAPVAVDATNITTTGFTANWNASNGATNYWIDVSTTDDFSNILASYNNKSVGNVTTFVVISLLPNTTYYFRVCASNNSGTSPYSNTITVVTSTTGVDDYLLTIPTKFDLSQNYPNPFNPSTNISYKLQAASYTTLKIYDMLGKEVATLVNEEQPAGTYQIIWNGTDNFGNKVTSGVYFYRIAAGGFVQTKKMTLLK